MSSIEFRCRQIAQKYDISLDTVYTTGNPKVVSFNTPGLPILPFFTRLAAEFDIPIGRITAEDTSIDSGCPTCGSPEINYISWKMQL